MSVHYNAFISYRHMPEDIRAAEEIQRQLERFHIPSDLQKKYGIQRIERVFRDKEELPTTSSLTDDIENALKNSDYLIVICTSHTKDSKWIRREIDLFLETHDQNRIMTVLAEGDPAEVIPERLLYRIRKVKDSDGNEVEIKEELEPLSCDYRMDFRKARKTELPRLVSVIIGCSYDELMRRRQTYMRRRITAIASVIGVVAAGFIAYLLWSRNQIQMNYLKSQENLRQSQINQSQFLSRSALDALDNHDRILALQLALEAMPKEGDERPLIADAEYAMIDALEIYRNSGNLEFSSSRIFTTTDTVDKVFVSPDFSRCAALDYKNELFLWNLETGEQILHEPCDPSAGLYDAGDYGFITVCNEGISIHDWQTGKSKKTVDVSPSIYSFRFDLTTGYAVYHDYDSFWQMDGEGNVKKIVDMNSIPEENPEQYSLNRGIILPDRNLFIAEGDMHEKGNLFTTTVVSHNLETGISKIVPHTFTFVDDYFHLKNGNIVFIDLQHSLSDTTLTINEYTMLYDMNASAVCVNPEDASVVWSVPMTYRQADHSFSRIFKQTDGSEVLAVTLANHQYFIDTESGEILHHSEWPDIVINILIHTDNIVNSVLTDGNFTNCHLNGDSQDNYTPLFPKDLNWARFLRLKNQETSALVNPLGSNQIIMFERHKQSPAYVPMFPLNGITPQGSIIEDNMFVLYATDNYEKYYLNVYDVDTNELIYQKDLGENKLADFQTTTDHRLILVYEEGNSDEKTPLDLIVDPATGEEKPFVITRPYASKSTRAVDFSDDTFLYAYTVYDTFENTSVVTGRNNPITGEADEFKSGPFESLGYLSSFHSICDNKHALVFYENCILLADYENKTLTELPAAITGNTPVFASCEDAFSIQTRENLSVFNLDGTLRMNIPSDYSSVVSVAMHNNEMYVLNVNGAISRYDASGKLQYIYEGSPKHLSPSSENLYNWEFSEDTFLLYADKTVEVYDYNQKKCRLFAENSFGYDTERKRIYTIKDDDTDESEFGYFRILSTEELVAEAQNAVGDIPLSDDVKTRYGLD